MSKETTKDIAGIALTVGSGIYITDINDDTITVRYGYQTSDGKVYRRRTTRPLEYDYTPEWSDEPVPSFTYYGDRYFVDEFMSF